MELEHRFFIQIDHRCFYSETHGILAASEPLRADDAVAFGLTPILVYHLRCSGSGNQVEQICRHDRPLDPLEFLLHAWRSHPVLGGLPHRLKVADDFERQLPGFIAVLRELGIRIVEEPREDADICERHYGGVGGKLLFTWYRERNRGQKVSEVNGKSLAAVNRYLFRPREWRERRDGYSQPLPLGMPVPQSLPQELLQQAHKAAQPLMKGAAGSKLFAARQAGIDRREFALICDNDYGLPEIVNEPWRDSGIIDVLTIVRPEWPRPEFAGQDPLEDAFIDNLIETVDFMIDGWPTGIAGFCREIGVAAGDLEAMRKRRSVASEAVLKRCREGLNIAWRDGFVDSRGGLVLVARDPENTERIFTELAHGGDLEFGAEILPLKGKPDQDWRLLFFWACGGSANLMLFRRGEPAERLLDPDNDSLINRIDAVGILDRTYELLRRIALLGLENPGYAARALLAVFQSNERTFPKEFEKFYEGAVKVNDRTAGHRR